MCNGVKPLYRTEEGVHHRELKFSRFYDEHDVCFFLSGLQWYVFVGLSAIVRIIKTLLYTVKNAYVATILSRSCNNLLQQADIRMRSHGLRQLVDDKSVASCQQTCCKYILQTFYQQTRFAASCFNKL